MTDLADSVDLADSTDSADLVDLTDLADSTDSIFKRFLSFIYSATTGFTFSSKLSFELCLAEGLG